MKFGPDVIINIPTKLHLILIYKTKHHICEAATAALYMGDSGFRSWPRGWLSLLRFLWFSSVCQGKCQDST
jgi:hypothetical protein